MSANTEPDAVPTHGRAAGGAVHDTAFEGQAVAGERTSTGGLELLTGEEMARAERHASLRDVTSLELMESAGAAVAEAALALLSGSRREAGPPGRILVLCGSGNNGGDGFVAARHLKAAGHEVRLALRGQVRSLRGDAALVAAEYTAPVEELTAASLDQPVDLVVDALVGSGLRGPLKADLAEIVERLNGRDVPVLAVDVPSGLDASTGEAAGACVQATRTITFFRRKIGHLLYPGRALCGVVDVAPIGLPDATLRNLDVRCLANAPDLWRKSLPRLAATSHKYQRGHAVVVSGGPQSTGAARLGARAALRVGAGLVTVASPPEALAINASQLTAVMVQAVAGEAELAKVLADARKNAVLVGPGAGVGEATQALVLAALRSRAAVVLDADALTSFAPAPARLLSALASNGTGPVVLTPHEGELARLFPDLKGDKLSRARAAAQRTRAVVVLKGADTVVAHPDGRAAINDNAPPTLATAGSGDVLAGLVLGLLAQRQPAFEAAAAAVWLHGACAAHCGPGLIAEDLSEALPAVLGSLAA